MKYKAKKLFRGCVSVRDYVVEKCISKDEDLTVTLNDRVMTIPHLELQNKMQFHTHQFQSKYGNKKYELYDFPFISDDMRKPIKT